MVGWDSSSPGAWWCSGSHRGVQGPPWVFCSRVRTLLRPPLLLRPFVISNSDTYLQRRLRGGNKIPCRPVPRPELPGVPTHMKGLDPQWEPRYVSRHAKEPSKAVTESSPENADPIQPLTQDDPASNPPKRRPRRPTKKTAQDLSGLGRVMTERKTR